MKAGNILKLAASHYIETQPKHLRPGITETLNRLLSAAQTFNTDLAATTVDHNLSPRGRSAGARRVALAALEKLSNEERNTVKGLDDHAKHLEGQLVGRVTLTPPTDPAERMTHELHMQEIRSQLRELPAAQRLIAYMTTSDPMVLAAIETAPPTLSEKRPDGSRRLEAFIDPEQRTAAALARAERSDPETAQQLREIGSLREVYTLAINSVRKEILDEVPGAMPESKPTIHISS